MVSATGQRSALERAGFSTEKAAQELGAGIGHFLRVNSPTSKPKPPECPRTSAEASARYFTRPHFEDFSGPAITLEVESVRRLADPRGLFAQ